MNHERKEKGASIRCCGKVQFHREAGWYQIYTTSRIIRSFLLASQSCSFNFLRGETTPSIVSPQVSPQKIATPPPLQSLSLHHYFNFFFFASLTTPPPRENLRTE